MTERPWLTPCHFDFSKVAFDAPQVTMAPNPPFFVVRYTEPTSLFAAISTDRLVVVAAGYVDMETAPVLESALANAVDSYPDVCCDLAAVDFFSAAGVHVLLAAHDRAADNGSRFSVRGAYGITRRVLRITQVDRLLVGPDRVPTIAKRRLTQERTAPEGTSRSLSRLPRQGSETITPSADDGRFGSWTAG